MYFFSISFLTSHLFHCLPRDIYFLFIFSPAIYFIACLAIFHFYFFPHQPVISLSAQVYFISISFLLAIHFIGCLATFLFYFFPTQPFIVPAFHIYFILCPRLFHSLPSAFFIPALCIFHSHVRVCWVGCFDKGHMTNYQKWSKIKFVALHCSF